MKFGYRTEIVSGRGGKAMYRFLSVVAVLIISGCVGGGGERITDYTNHSTVYGWVDIDEVDGNHLYNVIVKQYRPKTEAPYYFLGIEKFKGGYLFYTHATTNGAFKLDTARAQSCLGFMCSNTYYEYHFGSQGSDVGAVTIDKPGVYFLGSYELAEQKTGWFEQGKFNVVEAQNGPSRKEMLEAVLANAPRDHPIVAERIRTVMRN